MSLDEAVKLACDPSVDDRQRQAAYQAVHRMKPEERMEGLRRIAEKATTWEMAASAAGHLIRLGVPDAAEIATRRLPDWSLHEQSVVLGAARETALMLDGPKPGIRTLARRALANVLNRPAAPKDGKDGALRETTLIDQCAAILGRDADEADKALLRKAVQRSERQTSLWLVLGGAKAMTDEEVIRARAVYADESLPVVVRAAAATAVSGRDPKAGAFAEKRIRDFLAQFGGKFSRDDLESLKKRLAQPDGKQFFEEFMKETARFKRDEGLVAMLRFLETPAAEALTFEAFGCKNLHIQHAAAAVAAARWPRRFLSTDRAGLSASDYANLLALIAHKHPELRGEVLKRISETELADARTRLKKYSSSADGGLSTDQLVFLFF